MVYRLRGIGFVQYAPLTSRKKAVLVKKLKNMSHFYTYRGFHIRTAFMDGEFDALQGEFPFVIHIAGKDEHVGDIERLIRVIKERVRAILSTLPFKKVPKVILRYLVRLVTLLLNVIPPQSGTVPFYSPRALIVGDQLDMDAIGTTRFGELCEVHEKTSPTNDTEQERTMPAVHLGTTGSPSGTHFFFNMATGRVIRRHQWTPRPYAPSDLRRVERYARDAPTTVVFADRRRVPIEDDDDDAAADAGSLAEDGDDDEFEYPSIPFNDDDDSAFDDETYSPSDDEDDGADVELSADEVSTDSLSLDDRGTSVASSADESQDADSDGDSLEDVDGEGASEAPDADTKPRTTRSGRRVRTPANLCPTDGGGYTTTRRGVVHAAADESAPVDAPAQTPELVRHMLLARMGDHDSVAAIRDMHAAGEATKADYAAALGCYKRVIDTSRYVRYESRAVNCYVCVPFPPPRRG